MKKRILTPVIISMCLGVGLSCTTPIFAVTDKTSSSVVLAATDVTTNNKELYKKIENVVWKTNRLDGAYKHIFKDGVDQIYEGILDNDYSLTGRYKHEKNKKISKIVKFEKGEYPGYSAGYIIYLDGGGTYFYFIDDKNSLMRAEPGTAKGSIVNYSGGSSLSKSDMTVKKFLSTVVDKKSKNGWYKENGGYKYYNYGKMYTGWHYMGSAEGEKTPHWSYFGKDGKIYTGWRRMGKVEGEKTVHWSYFGPNGWLRTGWQQMGTGTSNPDGNAAKHWSYFGGNGWLRTGWVQLGKGTSNPDGNAAKHWSYFGNNGWLRTGWQQLGKGTSNPDGNAAKHWSYFGSNGWLRTGLVTLGKADGEKVSHKSYFGNNGWLRVNQNITVSGTNYKADSRGWLTVYANVKILTVNKSWTSSYSGSKNSLYKLDFNTWKRMIEKEWRNNDLLGSSARVGKQVTLKGKKVISWTSSSKAFDIKALNPGVYCILVNGKYSGAFQVYDDGTVRYCANYTESGWGKSGKVESGNLIRHETI